MTRGKDGTVTWTQEHWRHKWEQVQAEKRSLEVYLWGRQHENVSFYGSARWPVEVRGNKLYTWHSSPPHTLSNVRVKRQLCGVLFKNGWMGLHQSKAPRWLRNWAKGRSFIALLPKLDRPTLDAFLMIGKLKGE